MVDIVVFLSIFIFYSSRMLVDWQSRLYSWLSSIIVFSITVFTIDDLPDEAYVWAEKIHSLKTTGTFGVPLWDGTFGESSVGTLGFILSFVLRFIPFVSFEMALLTPVILTAGLCTFLTYVLMSKSGYRNLQAFFFSLILGVCPPLIISSSMAFDNTLALLLLILYIGNIQRQNRSKKIDLILVSIAPLIRLELALFSFCAIFFILKSNRASNTSNVLSRKMIKQTCFILAFWTLWCFYKIWKFDSLVPAMARYKSPKLDIATLSSGSNYLVDSVGASSLITLFCVFILVFIRIDYRKKSGNLQSREYGFTEMFSVLTITTLAALVAAVGSGGDYFGPGLARYSFPYQIAWAISLLVFVKKRGECINSYTRSLIGVSLVSIILSLHQVPAWVVLKNDLKTIEFGRSTCDYYAAKALQNYLSSIHFYDDELVVGTPEVNGLAFHLGASLLDMSGLVDSRPNLIHKPLNPGDPLNKYQIYLTDTQIKKASLFWLTGANCFNTTEYLARENELLTSKTVSKFFDSERFYWRMPQWQKILALGFQPVLIVFNFEYENKKYVGTARMLINSNAAQSLKT